MGVWSGGSGPWGVPGLEGAWSWGVSGPGGSGPRRVPRPMGVPGGDPAGRILLRAVRILLECILVVYILGW